MRTNGRRNLKDNEILANASSGLEIRHGAKPLVRRNRISLNTLHAIRVYDGRQGVFEHNDLRRNAAGAWDVSADCQDKVIRTSNKEGMTRQANPASARQTEFYPLAPSRWASVKI